MSLIQAEMPHVVRRKLAKAFDVNTHTREKGLLRAGLGHVPLEHLSATDPKARTRLISHPQQRLPVITL